MKPVTGEFKDTRYFNSTKNYTLALLNAFNDIKFWVDNDEIEQKEYRIPISFGNYEKALVLSDMKEEQITKNNFNFLPRLVLSFIGMTKASDRQTQKYQKFSRRINNNQNMQYSYNSVAYDFQFQILLQTRGLTINTQVVEEMLCKFNPTLALWIQEFPIFAEATETQISISDPQFEILDEFQDTDTNIINTTFDINLRGNIYSPLSVIGRIEEVKLFFQIWDKKQRIQNKIASYYKYDINKKGKATSLTERHFNATGTLEHEKNGITYKDIEETENHVLKTRPDYEPFQIETKYFPEEEK